MPRKSGDPERADAELVLFWEKHRLGVVSVLPVFAARRGASGGCASGSVLVGCSHGAGIPQDVLATSPPLTDDGALHEVRDQ